MLKDLIIFQKAYDFLKWVHGLVARYPKAEKFVLAQRTENSALELVSAVVEVNSGCEKAAGYNRVNLALEQSRIWLRLGFELKYASLKQYEFGARRLNEIGRLLGGWKKKFEAVSRAADGTKGQPGA